MSMSRADHYRKAQDLLAQESRYPGERFRELALIHATLAAADPGVELEATHAGPEPVAAPEEGTFGPGGVSRIYGMTPGEAAVALLAADGLRERLERLANELGRAYPNYGAASHAVQRIREELAR